MLTEFLSGGIMIALWAVSLFFLKFWRQSKDRLFLIFSLAFFLRGTERIGLVWFTALNEARFLIYIIRLCAFLLIIYAIVDKNRGRK